MKTRYPRAGRFVPLIFLLCLAVNVSAQTAPVRYVNDLIHIDVRDAPRDGAGLIDVIPSGTRMVVLERDDDSGYSRVRLDSGETGWVRHQFLTDEPIARERVAAAESEAGRLRAEREQAVTELATVRERRDELDARVNDLEQENTRLQAELDEIREINAEAITISERAQEFEDQARHERLQREQAEAVATSAQTRQMMFAAIAGIAGLAVGFYIGSIPVRREKRWAKVD